MKGDEPVETDGEASHRARVAEFLVKVHFIDCSIIRIQSMSSVIYLICCWLFGDQLLLDDIYCIFVALRLQPLSCS